MAVDDSMTCEADSSTPFISGGPDCSFGIDENSGNKDVYVQVDNLRPRQFQYIVKIDGIVNPPSAKFVQDIECHTCDNSACDPSDYVESYTRNRLQWNSVELDVENVKVTSDS